MNISENGKSIVNGALWLGFSALILKIIGVIYKIPLSYMLTDEGMGYFNSAYTIYTVFYILGSAGIPKAISIISAKSDESVGKGIFLVAFKVFLLLGFGLFFVLFLFSGVFSRIISGKNATAAIMAISPSVFFVCGSGVLRGYLSGRMKFFPIAISELIGGICKLFLGLLFAKIAIEQGYALPVVCSFSIMGITVGTMLGMLYLYSYYIFSTKGIKTAYQKEKSAISEILKIAAPITLAASIGSIVNLIDLSVIMNGLSRAGYTESVGAAIYGNYTTLAVPMFTAVTTLINPISVSALPIMTKRYHINDKSGFFDAVTSAVKLTSYISVPAFFIFMFFSKEVLSLLFESGSAALGAPFLSLLAPAVLFYSLLNIFNTALEGGGRVKTAVASLLLGGGVKLLLSIILIRNDNFGAIGAPIGTSVSYFVSLLFSYFAFSKKWGLNVSIYKSVLPSFAASLIALIPSIFIYSHIFNFEKSKLNFIIVLCFYAILYLIVVAFSLYITEKKQFFLSKYTKNKVEHY